MLEVVDDRTDLNSSVDKTEFGPSSSSAKPSGMISSIKTSEYSYLRKKSIGLDTLDDHLMANNRLETSKSELDKDKSNRYSLETEEIFSK